MTQLWRQSILYFVMSSVIIASVGRVHSMDDVNSSSTIDASDIQAHGASCYVSPFHGAAFLNPVQSFARATYSGINWLKIH